MKRLTLILLVIAISVACSKTEPTAKPGPAETGSGSNAVDYKAICERLVSLVPASRQATFTQQSCLANYQSLLPTCSNAAAVNDCFVKLKSWDGRLACMDSCVRTAAQGK
ncbi:MAG: hypothetical protein WC100_11735 [Sterolibacterium sp.]